MSEPFRIVGPAVISFSGGRTSGYMLWRILQEHGGTLPEDAVVCFANTGREMPATLDFVRDCGAAWNVPIVWLEFTARRADGFQVVSHNSAARNGEPLAALMATQAALPNPVARSCTIETKLRTMRRYCRATHGWKRWTNVIGLRADEMHRVERAMERTKLRKDPWDVSSPLATAGVRLGDVHAFWREQPFDLRLNGRWEGNCDGCFLKSRAAIMRMHRDYPERMKWWAEMEAVPRGDGRGKTFRADREPYAELARITSATPMLPLDETMIEGGEECGMACGI